MRSHSEKRDANEQLIVAAFRSLRRNGVPWLVQKISGGGVPDLLLFTGVRFIVAEVKDGQKPACHRKLTATQVEWHREWGGAGAPVYVVTSVAEVATLGRHEGADP